jgi:hypothetical protein
MLATIPILLLITLEAARGINIIYVHIEILELSQDLNSSLYCIPGV